MMFERSKRQPKTRVLKSDDTWEIGIKDNTHKFDHLEKGGL